MITSLWMPPGGDGSLPRALRHQVFCRELGLEEALAWDSSDAYGVHLVLLLQDKPVATGRITYGGVGLARLERICVLPDYRRQGIGDGLVKVLDYKAAQMGMKRSLVEAPEALLPFYQRIGFVPRGGPVERWGLTLIPMEKETNDGTRENCAHQCPGP